MGRRVGVLMVTRAFGRSAAATSEGNVNCVHHMVTNNRQLTITQVCNVIRISRENGQTDRVTDRQAQTGRYRDRLTDSQPTNQPVSQPGRQITDR